MHTKIQTDKAPTPVGTYSQAIKCQNTIYCAGQIGVDPQTNELVSADFRAQAQQAFKNLAAVCEAATASLQNIVRITIYLTDLKDFATLNEVMQQHFQEPYPARTTFQVAALPKNAVIEVDAILTV